MSFSHLSDEALLAVVTATCSEERHVIARQVLYLAEVEDRRLELTGAYSSMFDFCTRGLGMSDGIAFRRLNAARLSRKHPTLIGALERGDVHLCGLALLKDVITDENFDEVLAEATGKSMRQLGEIVARRKAALQGSGSLPVVLAQAAAANVTPSATAPSASEPVTHVPSPAPAPEPRCRIHLDATAALQAKLDRARDLMSHRVPDRDLAAVVERGIDLLIAQLEKERLGKSERPQRVQRPTKPGRIARAVRREVFERDGEQCTFIIESGARCPSRTLLELDHIESRALGGSDDASNLRVHCRAHNRLHAEEVFGADHVKRRIEERGRGSRRGRRTVAAAPTTAGETTAELCIKGLTNMGFAEGKARRVVTQVVERRAGGGGGGFEALFREALTALT